MTAADRPRLRVLHTITWLRPGGMEMWLLRLATQANAMNWEIGVACKAEVVGELAANARQVGVEVLHVPLRLNPSRYVRELRRIIEDGDYDIVHDHMGAHAGLATAAAIRAKVPVVTMFHNTAFPAQVARDPIRRSVRWVYSRASIGYAVRRSTVIAGCSRAVLDSVSGLPCGSGTVIPLGVPVMPLPSAPERAALRRRFGWSNEKIVLHVGSFTPQKNHLGLLAVFSEILDREKLARLVLVGDGPGQQSVKEAVDRSELKPFVAFLGRRDDVFDLMSAADVFLLPSHHEGFPVVTMEAAVVGLPVVGTDVPGLNEAVLHGETGLLAPHGNHKLLAERATQLLASEDLRLRLVENARQRVVEGYSTEASAAFLDRLYRSCVATGKPSP